MTLIKSIRICCGSLMTKGPLVSQQITVRDFSKLKTIEERLGIPPKPKRPLSGYMRFSVENRPKVKEIHPTLQPSELSKIMGRMWHALSDELKEEYSKEFNEKKFDYIAQMREYQRTLTEDEKKRINELQSITAGKKARKNVLLTLRQQQELGRPKRPINPFVKFFVERSRKRDAGNRVALVEYRNFYLQVVNDWRAMSDDEKAKYRSPAELENYKKAMLEWRGKMMTEGRGDVIPPSYSHRK